MAYVVSILLPLAYFGLQAYATISPIRYYKFCCPAAYEFLPEDESIQDGPMESNGSLYPIPPNQNLDFQPDNPISKKIVRLEWLPERKDLGSNIFLKKTIKTYAANEDNSRFFQPAEDQRSNTDRSQFESNQADQGNDFQEANKFYPSESNNIRYIYRKYNVKDGYGPPVENPQAIPDSLNESQQKIQYRRRYIYKNPISPPYWPERVIENPDIERPRCKCYPDCRCDCPKNARKVIMKPGNEILQYSCCPNCGRGCPQNFCPLQNPFCNQQCCPVNSISRNNICQANRICWPEKLFVSPCNMGLQCNCCPDCWYGCQDNGRKLPGLEGKVITNNERPQCNCCPNCRCDCSENARKPPCWPEKRIVKPCIERRRNSCCPDCGCDCPPNFCPLQNPCCNEKSCPVNSISRNNICQANRIRLPEKVFGNPCNMGPQSNCCPDCCCDCQENGRKSPCLMEEVVTNPFLKPTCNCCPNRGCDCPENAKNLPCRPERVIVNPGNEGPQCNCCLNSRCCFAENAQKPPCLPEKLIVIPSDEGPQRDCCPDCRCDCPPTFCSLQNPCNLKSCPCDPICQNNVCQANQVSQNNVFPAPDLIDGLCFAPFNPQCNELGNYLTESPIFYDFLPCFCLPDTPDFPIIAIDPLNFRLCDNMLC